MSVGFTSAPQSFPTGGTTPVGSADVAPPSTASQAAEFELRRPVLRPAEPDGERQPARDRRQRDRQDRPRSTRRPPRGPRRRPCAEHR
ncbi:hypothetical protein AB5I41_11065 [Sphingomonas sp. MMS24-JH45]